MCSSDLFPSHDKFIQSRYAGAVIYLPKEAPEVLKGQKIQVVDESGNVRFSGNSTLFKRDQLHSRLWV